MNLRGVLSNWELFAGNPQAVPRLRELILQLAVQGKLVPQDPKDEPASELLKKITAEKDRLVKEGKIKRDKPLAEIEDEEKPFELPQRWCWARLQQAFDVRDGTHDTPKYHPTGIPLVTSKNIYGGVLDLKDVKLISYEDHEQISARSRVDRHDILFAMIGSIGNPVLVDTDLAFSVKNVALFKYYAPDLACPQFLLLFLRTAVAGMKERAFGAVQSFVSLGQLRSCVIALPPLAEQSRIVTRVQELMQLCDALEAKVTLEAQQHETLLRTLLATLTQSANSEDLAQNWQRVSEHFPLLLDRPQAIDALEQTILQLAVRGLLVPQNPTDEPASQLLKKIRTEKDKLILEGKIKRDKPLPPIAEDEQPFGLPKGWEWVRLRDLVTHLGDGLHGTPNYSSNGDYFFVNGNNLGAGVITIKPETKRVGESEFEKHRKPLDTTSVLLSINGTLGRVAFYQSERIVLGKSACYFNVTVGLHKLFAKLLLECPDFMTYAEKSATGTTIKNLGLKAIGDWPIALPPLAEQHRIVTRTTELRQLCAALRSRLAQSSQIQAQFAQALVSQQG